MNYCPLNILSGYNFLSSALKCEDIFKMKEKMNYSGIGIADEGNMFAYSDLALLSKAHNDRVAYGASIKFNLDENTKLDLALYIVNETGYRNLVHLLNHYRTISNIHLSKYKEGLICVVKDATHLKLDEYDDSHKKILMNLSSDFDDFYLGNEVYSFQDEELSLLLRKFASEYNYKVVAFHKHLYLKEKDAIALRTLDAIKNSYYLDKKEESGPYYFLNEEELNKKYSTEELNHSYDIYLKCCGFDLIRSRGKMYNLPLENKEQILKDKCLKTLNELNKNNNQYLDRLDEELKIISSMGFNDYFLIVEDYVNYAKSHNIPVGPGRGSAAGSLVAYLLNITEVDPLEYGLLFERFLNPERATMPDIDVDFADFARNEVDEYVKEKYGKDKTCNIIVFQTFGIKGALNDVGKVFKIDNRDINKVSSACSKYSSFKDAYRKSAAFRELCKDDYFLKIIQLASLIEGLPRQSSLHPAGIIINDEALNEIVPLLKDDNGNVTCEFEGPIMEKMDFLKMDLLGLINLSFIDGILKYIKEPVDFKNIPLDDKETFDVLNKGMNLGIFQLEGNGIIRALKEIKVNSFNDLVALLALYRPGPMDNISLYSRRKNNHEQIDYPDPLLKDILKETYGVIIYQEQIMNIVRVIASYSLGKADLFRRAISKKDESALIALKDDFINNAMKNNITKEKSEEIFNLIYKFADYGFNKSHSVAYALLSYRLAYLKAHYPKEFFAAYLNINSLDGDKTFLLRQELKQFGLTLALPSINKSDLTDYAIDDNKLIIPLRQIKGINYQSLTSLKEIKKEKITTFLDLVESAYHYNLKDTEIVSLINGGALDELDLNRYTMIKALPQYWAYAENINNTGSLTKEEEEMFLPLIEKYEDNPILKYDLELKTLGIVLSVSLLEKYRDKITSLKIKPIQENITELNKITTIAGIITHAKVINTKKGEKMMIINFSDDSSSSECVAFPKTYNEFSSLLKEKNALLLKGYFQQRNDDVNFIINSASALED